MGAEEEILALMRFRGPVLPVDVGKTLKINLIIASAYLSEIASRQKVKISNLKIGGGSPLYYLPGQEARLQEFAKNLGEKDYRAYELLREKKVVRDSVLDPLMRVALRNIKDFAVSLLVTFQNTQETFWKWYLLPDEEAKVFINNDLEVEKNETVRAEAVRDTDILKKEAAMQQKEFVRGVSPVVNERVVEHEAVRPVLRPFAEEVRKEVDNEKEMMKGKELADNFSQSLLKEKVEKMEKEEKLTTKKAPRKKSVSVGVSDSHVRAFFSEKDIIIISQDNVLKGGDFTYVVGVPSPVGQLPYLSKVRQTKRCTDKDLGSALIEGQLKKLPVLFLYTGELTPKAEELAKTDMFKTLVLYHLPYGR